jgi:hypothetical protein
MKSKRSIWGVLWGVLPFLNEIGALETKQDCFAKAKHPLDRVESEKSPQPALQARSFHLSPFA